MNRPAATIYALSSGGLPSGVAVLRLSGAGVRFALEMIVGRVPEPRHASLVAMRAADGSVLDKGLVLFFPGPASFTGEDVAELHLHGGRAVVGAMLERLAGLGLHAAEAGEFTRRAFVNGKLDLTEAEALADLIDAETETQRRLALENAGGRQRLLYDGWRERLLNARAMIEASLDFSDEADVAQSGAGVAQDCIAALAAQVRQHLERAKDGEIVRDGYKVVLAGAPNAGKSSLFNWLAGRDAAIVTAEAGTTRDVIEVGLDLGGMLVRIFDTAGLRENAGAVEAIGIERARRVAANADLVLVLDDLTSTERVRVDTSGEVLHIGSKSDLVDGRGIPGLRISTTSGEGMDALRDELRARASAWGSAALGNVVPTRKRHAEALDAMLAGLEDAMRERDAELAAEGLRRSSDALGRLTGRMHTEEILGAIFSRFCIGK